jgi:hypothetical protein
MGPSNRPKYKMVIFSKTSLISFVKLKKYIYGVYMLWLDEYEHYCSKLWGPSNRPKNKMVIFSKTSVTTFVKLKIIIWSK